jgi:hypothetical protein
MLLSHRAPVSTQGGHFYFAEIGLFLTEEPLSARAQHVREEIAQLEQQPN